jgi:colanic acid biosynthesis glycosyl transferase WcaI
MTSLTPCGPKIVFVNRFFHPDQSATSQLLTDLAVGLAQSGHRIEVVCSRQRYDEAGANLKRADSTDGVSIHRVWTTNFGRHRLFGRAFDYATFYMSCALSLLTILKRGDTVVAKTDPPLISIIAMAAARLKGAHLINWLQDIFPEVASRLGANPLPRALDALLRRCRNRSLLSARMNVVLGARMYEWLLGFGVPASNIRIVENWAEAAQGIPKSVNQSMLRAKAGLRDAFVVGYSGNLGRAHEFQTLLEASALLQGDPNIVFLMVGGGAGMTRLQKIVAQRGLKNFRFLPYQPRDSLADSLAASDVHWVSLIPSLEGLIVPSKFYGILAAARPVIFIGDPEGEIARAIRAAQCGSTVAVNDADAFAQVVRDLKADPARRSRLGENGYHCYSERYSARRALGQWTDIINLRPPNGRTPSRAL